MEEKITTGNTRLAQWGLTCKLEAFCFYCKFVLADSFVFQNPPLRQAWERYLQPFFDNSFTLVIKTNF
jgi:hypothetical protein